MRICSEDVGFVGTSLMASASWCIDAWFRAQNQSSKCNSTFADYHVGVDHTRGHRVSNLVGVDRGYGGVWSFDFKCKQNLDHVFNLLRVIADLLLILRDFSACTFFQNATFWMCLAVHELEANVAIALGRLNRFTG